MSQSQTPTLAEVLREAIRTDRLELHTSIPGVIESWDASTGLADIRVAVKTFAAKEDGTMQARAHAILPSVPVGFQGGGGFRAAFPLQKGDPVEVLFQESSIDIWLEKGGGDVDPGDRRRHNISDPIFIPGPRPKQQRWSTMSADAASIGHDTGPQVVFRSDKIELGGDAANPPTDNVGLASLIMARFDQITQWMGEMSQAFSQHQHMVVGLQTAGSPVAHTQTAPVQAQTTTTQAPSTPSIDDVKSTIVLAD